MLHEAAGSGGVGGGKEEVKPQGKEERCHCFDGFSYSGTEINYSPEACMVPWINGACSR